jgi:hypothetical protein
MTEPPQGGGTQTARGRFASNRKKGRLFRGPGALATKAAQTAVSGLVARAFRPCVLFPAGQSPPNVQWVGSPPGSAELYSAKFLGTPSCTRHPEGYGLGLRQPFRLWVVGGVGNPGRWPGLLCGSLSGCVFKQHPVAIPIPIRFRVRVQ